MPSPYGIGKEKSSSGSIGIVVAVVVAAVAAAAAVLVMYTTTVTLDSCAAKPATCIGACALNSRTQFCGGGGDTPLGVFNQETAT
jgi:flagellar basal body-associated protein FliL